jgi:hypothetical protein
MFSAFAAGAFLVVTGSIGYDVSYLHGLFEGGRWVDRFIWWQVALGVGLLILAGYSFQRLGEPSPTFSRPPRHPTMVNPERGRTANAEQTQTRHRLQSGGRTT